MKKILLIMFLIGSVFTAGAWSQPLEAAETTEEVVVEETTEETTETEGTTEPEDEPTDEEIEEYINDAIALGLSLWDKIVALAGISSVGGMITAFVVINRKFKLFGEDSKRMNENTLAMKQAMEHMTSEERNMKKAMIAMINVANVDNYTKGEMRKLLEDDDLTMADFTEMANNLAQHKEKDTDVEESDTLLSNLTKE